MESDEGVSLPLIHGHSMVPWNDMGKGHCCGRFEAITDGYFCKLCSLFVHQKCSESSEYIQHPSHTGHALKLRKAPYYKYCSLCGRIVTNHNFYCCEICDFNMDLCCAKYPPPEVIEVSETHHHNLTLLKKRVNFRCDVNCGKPCYGFPYICHGCDLTFHVDCVWHPPEVKHPIEYTTLGAGGRVSLPWIHRHMMLPWNDMRKGDCCGRFEAISDGYYCQLCDFFVHKRCGEEASESIQHPSHTLHLLWLLRSNPYSSCDLCGKKIVDLCYQCLICFFNVDLCCAKYPPPVIIDNLNTHHHKLTLLKQRIPFYCDAKCEKASDDEFHYKCQECDIAFHVDCVWQPNITSKLEVNHSYHPWHPLTLLTGQLPGYCDGKCRLCGRKIDDRLFYHCSSCNFTLDMKCALKPPPQSLMELKAHDHQLTLLPRHRSFTCNACGMSGDRSPYICVQCDFTIHQDCLELPRLININRHDHRVSRTSIIGVVNSICRVCREKVDWTCGGYSCQRCPGYVVHSKCGTRKDVWNGKDLEGVPEELEDIEPYVVIDENTIQHFSHKEHNLRRHGNGLLWEENKRCRACNHPIGLQSYYGCIDCDFVLHQNCADFPKKKWHVLHNERLNLSTREAYYFVCQACHRISNGFLYIHGDMKLDVRCGSIYEPFVHPSHPHHPLYYIPPNKNEICTGCNFKESHVLRCIEDDCEFVLGFRCATLPQVVKHRVDDHPLSLCYGEEETNGKHWCDICERKISLREWFYTCKDQRATLHTNCVLGSCAGLMPRSKIEYMEEWFEVVLNNSVTRPVCKQCKSRCIYPIFLKMLETSDTYCSYYCI